MKMLFACVASMGLAAIGIGQSAECSHSCKDPGCDEVTADTGFGYGACYASSCHCKAFEGSDSTCSNCGHSYYKH